MKRYFALLLLILVGFTLHGQTIEVNGSQTGVWDADTVLVTGDVTVVGSLSVIRPGSVVLFDGFYGITVPGDASFVVQGADTADIVFTVADTMGFHIYNQGKGGWNGICLDKAGKVVMDYCVLQYGKASDTIDRFGGALSIYDCKDVTITNSILRCNFARECGGAIYAERSKVSFDTCVIIENKVYTSDNTYAMYGGGASFKKCDVKMNWMSFQFNYGPYCIGGALSLDSCSLILDHATFSHNVGINGGGMYLMRCNDKYCRISNVLFNDNYSRHFAGALAFADASPEVYNITVTRNSSEGVNCNGIFFYQESAPKLTNCIVYGNYPQYELFEGSDTIQMWLWTYNGFHPEFRNCLIEKGLKSITCEDTIPVFEDIIDADPLFRFPEGDNFLLQEGSPCIDAGNPIVPDFMADGLDLGYMKRVSNGRIDIGAYEYSAQQVPETPTIGVKARLFGNPLNDQSRIELDEAMVGEVTMAVYSMTGHCVARKSFGSGNTKVFEIGSMVGCLASGLYLIEVVGKDRYYTLKAVR